MLFHPDIIQLYEGLQCMKCSSNLLYSTIIHYEEMKQIFHFYSRLFVLFTLKGSINGHLAIQNLKGVPLIVFFTHFTIPNSNLPGIAIAK